MSHVMQTSDAPRLRARTRRFDLLEHLAIWIRRSASRSDLARLGARGLRDIGISRFDADVECSKPFWQG